MRKSSSVRQTAFVFVVFRVVAGLLLASYFVLALLILGLRYVVLPNLDDYRPRLEALASEALGVPVQIGGLEGSWHRLHPELVLTDTRILGPDGDVALALPKVQARLSWRSLASLRPQLLRLRVDEPSLRLSRDESGVIRIAGFPLLQLARQRAQAGSTERSAAPGALGPDPSQGRATPADAEPERANVEAGGSVSQRALSGALGAGTDLAALTQAWWQRIHKLDLPPAAWDAADHPFARWLLAQPDIWIRNATVSWQDEAGQLPALDLEGVNLRLQARRIGVSRFVLEVPGSFAGVSHLRLQAEWQRRWLGVWDGYEPGDWQGQVYLAVDQLDLNWLRPWLDAPVAADLQGLLATRIWLDFHRGAWQSWNADLAVRNLRWSATPEQPALALSGAGLSLRHANESSSLRAEVDSALLALPGVFADPVLVIHQLSGQLRREEGGQNPGAWHFDQVQADVGAPRQRAQMQVSGQWRALSEDAWGYLDLKGQILDGEAGAVARWTPAAVNPGVRHWLQDGLRAGQVERAAVTLRGPLRAFPYAGAAKGQGEFRIAGQVSGVAIDIEPGKEPGWPLLSGLQGELVIDRDHLWADIERGAIRLGESHVLQIGSTRLDIPNMSGGASIEVKGVVSGPATAMQAYLQNSPLADGSALLQHAEMSGELTLPLSLVVGLDESGHFSMAGKLQAHGNRIVLPGLPPLSEVQGAVSFTEQEASFDALRARWLGERLQLDGKVTQNGAVQLSFEGRAQAQAIQQAWPQFALSWLGGTLPYAGNCERQPAGDIRCIARSQLQGTSFSLPEPLEKTAASAWPLQVQWSQTPQGSAQLRAEVAERFSAVAAWSEAESSVPQRLGVSVPGQAQLPERGWHFDVQAPKFDLDAWQKVFVPSQSPVEPAAVQAIRTARAARAGSPVAAAHAAPFTPQEQATAWLAEAAANGEPQVANRGQLSWKGLVLPLHLNLQTPQLGLLGHDWGAVQARFEITAGDIVRLTLQSPSAQGRLGWRPESVAGPAKLEVDLDFLRLPRGENKNKDQARTAVAAATPEKRQAVPPGEPPAASPLSTSPLMDPARWPYVSLEVDELAWGEVNLGRLALTASPGDDLRSWLVDDLQLSLADTTLQGHGQWQARGLSPRSHWWLDGKVGELGALLARFGHHDVLEGGKGSVKGEFSWPGAPWEFSLAEVQGELQLDLEDGRFLPVSSTAGRLLGIFSLQSLARAIVFQGQNVFESGFVWTSLRTAGRLQSGQLDLQGFEMRGPTAAAVMQGQIDLLAETQDLKVVILPRIDTSAAAVLAGLAINPIVGVGAFLTQWLLQEPLAHVLSLEYAVTGSWESPEIVRLRGSQARSEPNHEQEVVVP